MSHSTRCFTASVLAAALLPAFLLPVRAAAQQPQALPLTGDYYGTHDPSIIKAGNTWYVFATGRSQQGGQLPIRCSTDLHAWKLCGQVFDAIPDWIRKTSPETRDLWAPDISFVHGEYRVYYVYSIFGRNLSGIALATNRTLDSSSHEYRWVDHGLVLKTGEGDDFNAIDPDFVLDAKGHAWLVFGSFWSGIRMRRLDDKTGLLSASDTTLYWLATRRRPNDEPAVPSGRPAAWQAVEAPFIVLHNRYYYLFVSWDHCCRGAQSNYRTMVGRSRTVAGPYLDKDGVPMTQGGGSELLTGNTRWVGPGGESVLMQHTGEDLIVFHAYDAQNGHPALQISTLTWQDDWPHAALGDQ